MTMYTKHLSPGRTSQSRPIPGTNQVPNAAGGYAWEVDRWMQLRRFLILGTEGGTYYIGERELTLKNAQAVIDCLAENPRRVVETINSISAARLAPKVSPTLFALALACSPKYNKDEMSRAYALSSLPNVARTGSHLLEFVANVNAMRGWGRALKRAVADWYLDKEAVNLAYQVEKYKNRKGWSHGDIISMCHPKAESSYTNAILGYCVNGQAEGLMPYPDNIINHSIAANKATTKAEIIDLIRKHDLTHEMIPTRWLSDKDVWAALLERIPATALIRNLGRITSYGVFSKREIADTIATLMRDQSWAVKSKLHPMAVFLAAKTYSAGHGEKGKLSWMVNPQIVQALDALLDNSVANVEPTGLNIIAGVDVSGSMQPGYWGHKGSWSPIEAAALMVSTLVKTESKNGIGHVNVVPFDTGVYNFTGYNDSWRTIAQTLLATGGGGTDVSLPIKLAIAQGYNTDAFIIYTDSETWFGVQHPQEAFDEYKNKVNPRARAVIVSMVPNTSTVGDPKDPSVMSVVGLDASVPGVINDFITGRIN